MTIQEVFLWFCREQDILPYVMISFYDLMQEKQNESFSNFFQTKLDIYSLEYMIPIFFDILFKKNRTKKNIDKTNLCRKWYYFVNNNVKHNSKINIGDEITYTHYRDANIILNGRIVYINLQYRYVIIGNGLSVPFRRILKVNNEPFIEKYYVKRRGKIYGLDK